MIKATMDYESVEIILKICEETNDKSKFYYDLKKIHQSNKNKVPLLIVDDTELKKYIK